MNDKHLEVLKEIEKRWISSTGRLKEDKETEALTYAITQLEKPRLEKLDDRKVNKLVKEFYGENIHLDIVKVICQKFGTRKVSVDEIERAIKQKLQALAMKIDILSSKIGKENYKPNYDDSRGLNLIYKELSNYGLLAQAIHDLIYIGKVKGE
ncbi:hypothetical protein LCGC14_1389290 [marine sediment metagenome]|uniref:Uncharacterized protein n=1 Tax=marine sediment metagenome TaxID=412755 RepID=A0A0F9MFY8_9ZZZZ